MIAEGEKFAEEDQLHKKKTEALNGLSSFVYGLKSQLADKEGMGGKLDKADKNALQHIIKEGSEWLDENGKDASLEDLEEKLAELQASVNPITSKLYKQGSPSSSDDDEFDPRDHGDL